MKTKLFALLCIITTFISCGEAFKNQNFYLSNPTDQEIKTSIDNTEYSLAPNTSELVKLTVGKHKITYQGTTNEFNVYANNTGGILNPTLAPHYIFSMVYAVEGNENRFKSLTKTLFINGVEYDENIKSTNALVIDNNLYRCTYSLGEAYPEEIVTHNKNATGNFFNKFFTQKELIQFLTGEDNPTQTNTTGDNPDTITEEIYDTIEPIQVTSTELQEIYTQKLALATEYKNATDANRQKAIQKEIFDLSMKVSGLDINYSKLSTLENTNMNTFELQVSRTIGAGILQLN